MKFFSVLIDIKTRLRVHSYCRQTEVLRIGAECKHLTVHLKLSHHRTDKAAH
jgi:hypothetical protein